MIEAIRSRAGRGLVALAVVAGSVLAATSLAGADGPKGGDVTPLANVGPTTVFQAIVPCRLVDTRIAPDPEVSGRMLPNETLAFDVLGPAGADYFLAQGGGGCDIPLSATAVELTFTAVDPLSGGFVRAFPASSGPGAAGATVLNYGGGGIPTNSVTVAVGYGEIGSTDGEIAVRNSTNAGGPTIYMVIDATGYFVP